MIRTIVVTENDARTLRAASRIAQREGDLPTRDALDRMATRIEEAFTRPVIAGRTQIVSQPVSEPARYDLVGAEMLSFASYCGNDYPKVCTPARPCPSCLGMSNIFRVWGRIEYVRQLAPEWNVEPPPIRSDHMGIVEERVRRKIRKEKRASAKAAGKPKVASHRATGALEK
ncbi:MAG: hypothetical protein DI527_00605 [Chelatococcus sp.]|nr:MAG: hypothetical protein DI527_00605 [Chelatococcus sp.]